MFFSWAELPVSGPPVSCAFYDDPSNFKTSRVSPKLVGDRDSTTQEAGKQIKRCESGEDSCFTIWSYDGENNTETMTIIKQGQCDVIWSMRQFGVLMRVPHRDQFVCSSVCPSVYLMLL